MNECIMIFTFSSASEPSYIGLWQLLGPSLAFICSLYYAELKIKLLDLFEKHYERTKVEIRFGS